MKSFIRINTKYKAVKNGMTKENLYKSNVDDYLKKNKYILTLKRRADNYISYWILSHHGIGIFSQKDVYNAVFNIRSLNTKVEDELLTANFQLYFQHLENEHNYQKATLKYYNNLLNCLKEYEKQLLGKRLWLSHFNDKANLIDFSRFLATKRLMNDNTIRKRINTIKSFLKYCVKKGLCTIDLSVFDVKVEGFETNVVALNKTEIQQLVEKKIDNPFWQKIVDVFVCNCYMGLRVSDLMTMDKGQFIKDEDNDYFYVNENTKTGIVVTIPITEIPLAILEKYNFRLPVYSPQYFNRELGKILEHYKLFETTVTLKRKVLKENKNSKVLKRTLITSHTCRKSFVTNCVSSGIALNVIMKASGHKQLKTLQAYVQKIMDKEQFKKLNKKTTV